MRAAERHDGGKPAWRQAAIVVAAAFLAGCAQNGAPGGLFLSGDAAGISRHVEPTAKAGGASSTTAYTNGSGNPAATGRLASISDDSSFIVNLKRKIDAAFTPQTPSRAERQRLGNALAEKVLARVRLIRDAALQKRLEGIVQRLAQVAAQDNTYPAQWRLYIIDDARPDAFTAGGGYLFITRGMVELLRRDERIATVLAHEMAHNLLGHIWDAREKKDMARRAHRFSKDVLAKRMRMAWLGKSVAFVVDASLNTYSRQQEYDADAEGLDLLVRAGWKPQVALETFDFLKRHFREEPALRNFFYNNHPLYARRRWYIANRIRAYYRKQAGLPPVQRMNWKTRQ